jgi:hypothetical protein
MSAPAEPLAPTPAGFDTPVLLLLWRRPETTRRLLQTLRAVRPRRLFVACDGPRAGDAAMAAQVAATRALVEEIVDWPCTLERRYTKHNQGCRDGVSGALDWFFGEVEAGLVLEDDCVPHPDFFSFGAAMLERYAHDERIWVITGDNFQRGRLRGDGSYYLSRYPHCWGWGSWRRAWRHFDKHLAFWPAWRDSPAWRAALPEALERRYWAGIFERIHAGQLTSSWAYPWTACVWHHGGLTVTPNANLVMNIGTEEPGTHMGARDAHLAPPAAPLGPLRHPSQLARDAAADAYTFDQHFGGAAWRFPRVLWTLPQRAAGRALRAVGLLR